MRTFIAIEPPARVRESLAALTGGLREAGAQGIRWVRPEGVHLTLRFLGDVNPNLVDGIAGGMSEAAQEAGPIRLSLGPLGVFPTAGNPRVIWVGVEGDLDGLRRLQESVEDRMAALGFARDRRRFAPHLTLGRVKSGPLYAKSLDVMKAAGTMAAVTGAGAPGDSWEARRVSLIHSVLTPEGAVYRELAAAPLGG